MDKITRMLYLYSLLIDGRKVNKTSYCLNADVTQRTFDRDIESFRIYLSEFDSTRELIYDRSDNTYYLTGRNRKPLENVEFLFWKMVLEGISVLRSDEEDALLYHLALNTEAPDKLVGDIKTQSANKEGTHNRATLKMYGDLIAVIKKRVVIRIVDWSGVDKSIVPAKCILANEKISLICYDTNNVCIGEHLLIPIEEICSFTIERATNRDEAVVLQIFNSKED